MQWIDRSKQVKYVLVVVAVSIATISLVFSHYLVKTLEKDTKSKMVVWAEAMRSLNKADENTDLSLVLKVINNNDAIPVVVLNRKGEVLDYRNLKLKYDSKADSVIALRHKVEDLRREGYSIKLSYDPSDSETNNNYMEVLYDESLLLKRLSVYPYIQIGIVAVFLIIMAYALLSSKRAEQNRVWVGLTKEIAHQLGTPISSLMAWIELLRETYPGNVMVGEMNKDVERLNLIAERFSKIGSMPESKEENLNEVMWHVVNYLSMRTPDQVEYVCNLPASPVYLRLCAPLFEWVIENLCKNAIDAMSGRGRIVLTMHELTSMVIIEVTDTGKGIARNRFKSVFVPGYTTKQRGWGLGLSLVRRIVEVYHKGRIYVKNSEVGKGTTFRIELRK